MSEEQKYVRGVAVIAYTWICPKCGTENIMYDEVFSYCSNCGQEVEVEI